MDQNLDNPSGFNLGANFSASERRERMLQYLQYEEARRTLAKQLIGQNAEKIELIGDDGRSLAIIQRKLHQEPQATIDTLGITFRFTVPPDMICKSDTVYIVHLDRTDSDYASGDPPSARALGINTCNDPRLDGGFQWLQGFMPTSVLQSGLDNITKALPDQLKVTPISAPKV